MLHLLVDSALFIGMDHILGKTSKEMIPLSSNASITLGMNIAW